MNLFFVLCLIDKHIALTRFGRRRQRVAGDGCNFDAEFSTLWSYDTILTRCGGLIAWF